MNGLTKTALTSGLLGTGFALFGAPAMGPTTRYAAVADGVDTDLPPITRAVRLAPPPPPGPPPPGPTPPGPTPPGPTPPGPTPPPPGPPPPPPPGGGLGAPLAGLTNAQLALFNAGRLEFGQRESPQSGLGPIFNDVSCVACHNSGAPGGAGPVGNNVTRFGKLTNGVFDPMEALGGSLLQSRAIDPGALEIVPATATFVAQRQTTPLFGLGLIEAIPDATIRAIATAQNANSATTGITGRAAMITDVVSGTRRVGRFGWKAQQATLLAFSGDAYLNEMGITNRFFPRENAPNGDLARLVRFDRVADIEDAPDPATGRSDVDALADFMRLLAPPPQQPLTTSASAGMALFDTVQCSTCHTPMMTTGPNSIAALSNKPVQLYSDLLLHYMGTLGDRIAQGPAGLNEMKTPPLWGLRASAPYLHDGRAASVDLAIRAHTGEATASRNLYLKLTVTQRQQVLDFLGTL